MSMTAEEFAELRELSPAELQEELLRLRREQFGMRMQRASEQLPQTHLIKETRRDIARVKTLLTAKAAQQAADDKRAAQAEENAGDGE